MIPKASGQERCPLGNKVQRSICGSERVCAPPPYSGPPGPWPSKQKLQLDLNRLRTHIFIFFKTARGLKMAQRFGALAALPGGHGLNPSVHMAAHNCLQLQSYGI